MKDKTDEFSFILKPSTIPEAGVGVFTIHDIAKGTKLDIIPDENRSRRFKKEDIPGELLSYCVAKENDEWSCPLQFNRMWIGWYMNHSENPNTGKEERIYYALRDIKQGEEILINYNILSEPEDKKEDYYKAQ